MTKPTKLNLLKLLLVHSIFSISDCATSPSPSGDITSRSSENVAFIAPSGKVIAKWVPLTRGGNLLLSRQDPAGLEESIPLYICRGKANDNRDKPGKLFINDGYYSCTIPEYGEIKRQHFDLLETPAGSTSWIPYSGNVPDNAIPAGTNPDGTTAYICRAKNWGALLVGSLHGISSSCIVPRAAREHVIYNDNNNIEIFVVNACGLAL